MRRKIFQLTIKRANLTNKRIEVTRDEGGKNFYE